MLFGPVFGAIAVILTGLTTNLFVLGGTRLLEGASTAASVPSILGYIALATAGDEVLRGKAAARFEGATLAGIGVGFAVAPLLFAALGPTAFFLNALRLRRLVPDLPLRRRGSRRGASARRRGRRPAGQPGWTSARYRTLLRTSHVWLLAPTWIAVNASIGLWFSQSIFQFSQADPRLPGPVPAPRLHADRRSRSRRSSSGSSSGPACSTGATASRRSGGRRSSSTGSSAARSWRSAGSRSTTRAGLPLVVPIAGLVVGARSGCSCWPARRPPRSACWPTSPSAFPTDRGAIMGLYSVFLAIGQIIGSLIGGVAADGAASTACSSRRSRCCSIALLPLALPAAPGAPASEPEHPDDARRWSRSPMSPS